MTSTSTTGTHHESPARGLPRRILWVLLAVAVVANGVCSLSGLPAVVGSAFGVLALVSGWLLVRDHYRRRARTTDPTASGQSA